MGSFRKLFFPSTEGQPAQQSRSTPITDLFAGNGSDGVSSFEKFMINKLGGGSSPETSTGVVVNTATALRNTAVWCATSIRARSVATCQLNIYKLTPNGGRQVDTKHSLYSLFRTAPNQDQSIYQWLQMQQMNTCLRGNTFSQILRKGTSVTGLYPLHPDRMTLVRRTDGSLEYLYSPFSGQAGVVSMKPSQVLHIRGMCTDGLWGISPIRACANAIGVAMAAENFGGRFFANSARPSGVIQLDGEMEEAEFKKFKAEWATAYSGDNANAVAVLENGVKFSPISISNDESQLLESRQFSIPDIGTRIFFVPPVFMGDYTDAHFANMEQAALLFIRTCILPELRNIQGELTRSLLSTAEQLTHEICFDFDDLRMADALTTAQTDAIYRQWGVKTSNDIRKKLYLNPEEGGDVLDAPLNMAPISFDRSQIFAKNRTAPGVQGDQGATTQQDKNAPQPVDGQRSSGLDGQKAAFRAIFTDYFGRICRKEEQFLQKNGENRAKVDEFYEKQGAFMIETLKAPVLAICELRSLDSFSLRDFADLYTKGARAISERFESGEVDWQKRSENLANALMTQLFDEKEGNE